MSPEIWESERFLLCAFSAEGSATPTPSEWFLPWDILRRDWCVWLMGGAKWEKAGELVCVVSHDPHSELMVGVVMGGDSELGSSLKY